MGQDVIAGDRAGVLSVGSSAILTEGLMPNKGPKVRLYEARIERNKNLMREIF
jgi:hypothetical protein